MSLLDCLLLEHILWQQPDQQSRIIDFLLSQISEDDGLQSADYIFASEPCCHSSHFIDATCLTMLLCLVLTARCLPCIQCCLALHVVVKLAELRDFSTSCLCAGIFGRACAAIGSDKNSDAAVKRESVLREAAALRESLTDKLISLKSSQGVGIGTTAPTHPCCLCTAWTARPELVCSCTLLLCRALLQDCQAWLQAPVCV